MAREEATRSESGNNSFEDITRLWHKSNKRWDPHHAQDVPVVWRIMSFLCWGNAAFLISKLTICFCY